jgi:O-succinylbenzoate synthase
VLFRSEAAAVPAVVTSLFETSVGLAAGLALAAALPELPYACGLGTATLLAGDVVSDPLVPEGGMLRVRRPVPDPDLLARYRVADATNPAVSRAHSSG